MIGLITGTSTFLVGLEDMPDGGLKCYLGARWKGIYSVVYDPDVQREIRSAWAAGGHVVVPMPPADHIYQDEAPRDA